MEVKDGFYSFKNGLLSWMCLLTLSDEWQKPGLVPELKLNHVVSTVWGAAKGRRLEQSLFCRAGHWFSSLMWFMPSSQGRGVSLERSAHEFVIRAAVMQDFLLQSSACFNPARLEHTLPACLHPETGRGWETGKCAGGSLEESKTAPVAQFLLPL